MHASGDLFRARAVDFRTAGPVPASPRSNRSGGLFEEFLSHRRWIKSEEKEFFSRRLVDGSNRELCFLLDRILYINRSMQAPKTPTRWMTEEPIHTHLSTDYLLIFTCTPWTWSTCLGSVTKVKQAHVPYTHHHRNPFFILTFLFHQKITFIYS